MKSTQLSLLIQQHINVFQVRKEKVADKYIETTASCFHCFRNSYFIQVSFLFHHLTFLFFWKNKEIGFHFPSMSMSIYEKDPLLNVHLFLIKLDLAGAGARMQQQHSIKKENALLRITFSHLSVCNDAHAFIIIINSQLNGCCCGESIHFLYLTRFVVLHKLGYTYATNLTQQKRKHSTVISTFAC